jgi:uncharacterized protein YchJ
MLTQIATKLRQKIWNNNISNTNNIIYISVFKTSKYAWTHNIDDTINQYNIVKLSPCGSGKKYKNCCGKNA